MKFQDMFEELRKLSPWPVAYLPAVQDYIASFFGPAGNDKENRLLIELLELIVDKLESFPPDPDFFEDPKPWFQDTTIWVTVTRHHRKITLKAHYRFSQQKCVITELRIK